MKVSTIIFMVAGTIAYFILLGLTITQVVDACKSVLTKRKLTGSVSSDLFFAFAFLVGAILWIGVGLMIIGV